MKKEKGWRGIYAFKIGQVYTLGLYGKYCEQTTTIPRGSRKGTGGWGGSRFLSLFCTHSLDILSTSTPLAPNNTKSRQNQHSGRENNAGQFYNTEWKTMVLGSRLGSRHLGYPACFQVELDGYAWPGAGYSSLWGTRDPLKNSWIKALYMKVIP